MSNWIGRLQEEKNELALRLMKLDEFTRSERFDELSLIEKDILVKQENVMTHYLEILESRLASIRTKNLDKSIFHDEEEDERMKSIVRNGNDGEHYLITEEKEGYADTLSELKKEIEKMFPEVDETEYLTSSKANADKLNAAMKDFDKSCYEHLNRIAETEITPKALLKLGFEEEYQPPIDNQAGYLYYSFKMWGIELLSNASDEEGWYVFNDENNEIHNLRKLGDLITSLNELS